MNLCIKSCQLLLTCLPCLLFSITAPALYAQQGNLISHQVLGAAGEQPSTGIITSFTVGEVLVSADDHPQITNLGFQQGTLLKTHVHANKSKDRFEVKVWPNPFVQRIELIITPEKSSVNDLFEGTIIDAQGKVIAKQVLYTGHPLLWELPDIAAGQYQLLIYRNGQSKANFSLQRLP